MLLRGMLVLVRGSLLVLITSILVPVRGIISGMNTSNSRSTSTKG